MGGSNTLIATSAVVLLLLVIGQSEGLVTSVLGCGVELLANNLLCVKECRKEHHCSKLEGFCKKIKMRVFRKICNALLKCACPTCLRCVARCTIRKFIDHNVCYVGKYLKHLLRALKVAKHFDLEKREGQIDAIEEVLNKVVNKRKGDDSNLENLTAEESGLEDVQEEDMQDEEDE